MVRITIEIDDSEATVTTQGNVAPGASVPGELLAAAATASDGGAAPAGPPESLAVPPPPSAAAGENLDAGPAPGTRAEPQPSVTTEDGE